MRHAAPGLAALFALITAAGCAPTVAQHGYIPEQRNPADSVQVGVDTKTTVLARLGTPSTTSAFAEETWYYISAVRESFAFFDPETATREIIAIRFDGQDAVASVEKFGIERGRVVALADEKTPTRGRELGILEQIFGSIGNTVPIPATEEGRDNRR